MEFELMSKHLYEINKDIKRHVENILAEYDFTMANLKYLLVINRNKNINLNEISIKLNVDKAMVTRGIKTLAELGYIYKEIDKNDIRSYRLSISPKGEAILLQLAGIFEDWFDNVTQNFSDDEKKSFMYLIEKVYMNIKDKY